MSKINNPHQSDLGAVLTALLLGLSIAGMPNTATAGDASKGNSEPQSMDDLFGSPPPTEQKPAPNTPPAPDATNKGSEPASVDELFGTPPPTQPSPEIKTAPVETGEAPVQTVEKSPAPQPNSSPIRLSGFYRNELAYTYAGDEHWSKFSNMLDLSATGRTDGGIGWKLGGRVVYDPIYDLTNYYNSQVSDDQRFEAMVREAYFDYSAGDFDFRLGRQHIIWGEMVGLFFADVVSAKDLREFVLPDFDILRIPQWAGRAEYFKGDFHAEAVWIPYMTYDNIGKPGADFYPFKPPAIPGSTSVILGEDQPTGLSDSAYGLRLSYLYNGWDLSGFYYTPMDPSAAFKRLTPLTDPTILYQPIHNRIHQTGATLGKDLGPMVLKAEAVYTQDKLFSVTNPSSADGLVQQDFLDYIVGLEWSFPQETRFNVQLYQRWFPDHNPSLMLDKTESGISVLLSTKALHPRIEPELLLIHSLNRNDWLAEPKVTWQLDGNWQLRAGADIFSGPSTGLFGEFDNQDRVYTEVRYTF
ncbi:MAG: DUF1302 family protein [Thiobacillaceae bacterium]